MVGLSQNTLCGVSFSKKDPHLHLVNSGIFSPKALPRAFCDSPMVGVFWWCLWFNLCVCNLNGGIAVGCSAVNYWAGGRADAGIGTVRSFWMGGLFCAANIVCTLIWHCVYGSRDLFCTEIGKYCL
jgi:hypothetical protein